MIQKGVNAMSIFQPLKKLGMVMLIVMVGTSVMYAAYSEVTDNAVFIGGGGYSSSAAYAEDSAILAGGYSSVGEYESDSGMGARVEEQSVASIAISSIVGNATYANTNGVLSFTGDDNNYDVVSFNLSNITSQGTWADVNDNGMTASQNISTSNYAWTLTSDNGNAVPVYIWLKNSLGVYSGRYSDTIISDVTNPGVPGAPNDVLAGTDSPDLDTAATASYYASWTDGSDALSGVNKYQYQLLEDDSPVISWTDTGVASTSNLSPAYVMRKNNTYKLEVKTIDNAGNESSSQTSDGIAIGAPSIPLTKTVANKGFSGSDTTSGTSGVPGNILEYTIAFENSGTYMAEPMSIYDMIPADSVYATASAQANLNSGSATIYYVTDYDLTEVGSEPADKSTVKGIRWEIDQVDVSVTGNVVFQVVTQ